MKRAAIEHAARIGGLELAPETDITIEGADPVLPSPLHLGEGAATAIALVGQEAGRIWQMRGGKPQSMSIDVRHAAASLNSCWFVRIDGEAPGSSRPGTASPTGIWQCADGRFIFLHSSFTHAAGILDELGLDETASREEVTAATSKRVAFELEDALATKGLCAAVCRTPDEWAAHEQGALLAAKPVIEITKIGDAPPMPLPDGHRPLSGVRVLDLTRVLAGPTAARTLAEHGADVLHIASPNLPTVNLFEMDTGQGKRQAHLDLNDPSAAATLRDLVRNADVFSQGFQLGSLARRGFGPDDLARERPSIIYVSENAFGHDGPWQLRPGWEQLAQATSGVTALHAIDGRPALAPAAMNDYTTGYFAAAGAMMVLRRRAVEGGSWLVTVSLTQTSMWYLRLGADLDRNAATGGGDHAAITDERDTAYGRMRYLRPALRMSETATGWELPSAPLGSGEPVWL